MREFAPRPCVNSVSWQDSNLTGLRSAYWNSVAQLRTCVTTWLNSRVPHRHSNQLAVAQRAMATMFRIFPTLCLILFLWPSSSAAEVTGAQVEYAPHPGPSGYHAMCARAPRLCMADRRASRQRHANPALMTPSSLAVLVSLNTEINRRIRPASDLVAYGVADHWTVGERAGDCEDYVVAKKQALLAAGWHAGQLLYAVVESRQNHHAVLIVRTSAGDLVLDNLTDQIMPWHETGYRFVTRQSAEAPDRWVHLSQPSDSGRLITN